MESEQIPGAQAMIVETNATGQAEQIPGLEQLMLTETGFDGAAASRFFLAA